MANYDSQDANTRTYKGYTMERRDPFGFWYLTSQGKIPDGLNQAFTSTERVRNAIDTYEHLSAKPKARKVV